jgi:DNA-binding CsgD family transcriptional regulator
MTSFAKYFIARELKDLEGSGVLSESAKSLHIGHLKEKYAGHFYDKFPKAQYEDIEEALHDSFEKVMGGKHDARSAENLFKKMVDDSLSGLHRKKRTAKKSLSCVKVLKSLGSDMPSLIKRAERMLTSQEKKIIEMCSQGKSVRSIGAELGISAATAWRSLNDGLDKIRLSYGMKSRKLGR